MPHVVDKLKLIFIPKKRRGDSSGSKYIAIYHGVTRLYAKKYNVEKTKMIAKIARAKNARLLILPPYFNTGPVLEYSDNAMRRYVNRLFEQVSDSSIRAMKNTALSEDIDVFITSFLEKSGAYYYISSMLIDREGVIVDKYRKIVLTDVESSYGVHSGRSPGLFVSSRMKIGVLIENEVFVPELARVLSISGVDLLITSLNPLDYSHKMISTIGRARAIENGLHHILVGSIVEFHNKVVCSAPTIIYDYDGNIVFEYNSIEPAIIFIEQDYLLKKINPPIDPVDSVIIHRIISKYYKRIYKEFYERYLEKKSFGQSDKTSSSRFETEPVHHL
ncbi:MAG: hypothetical protein DRO40_09205 [Thermoprotei archaeon]|nr:MAG: hypothetical protein DRO40_09205 [Thermoprotei archaeon]